MSVRKIVSMRYFVYGVLSLFIAAMCFFAAFGSTVVGIATGAPSTVMYVVLGIGIVFVLLTVVSWTSAIRTAEGDDLFSGERGLLLSSMIVATLVIGGLFIVMAIDRDAWQGFIDASRR